MICENTKKEHLRQENLTREVANFTIINMKTLWNKKLTDMGELMPRIFQNIGT